jgi:lipoprotein-anchoring transpeptidase ErfK/SrfK
MTTSRLASLAAVCCAFATSPASATVDIRIDLSSQTMRVSTVRGGTEVWPVSTGRTGYVTPRGSYRPTRLARMHYSSKYNNSPMPHSIFFKGGYAIHGTGAVSQLGRPASHGCVRLSPRNAARLFGMVQAQGARITLTGSPPVERQRVRAVQRSGRQAVYAPRFY